MYKDSSARIAIGQTFGHFIVRNFRAIEHPVLPTTEEVLWDCSCTQCGKEHVRSTHDLLNNYLGCTCDDILSGPDQFQSIHLHNRVD